MKKRSKPKSIHRCFASRVLRSPEPRSAFSWASGSMQCFAYLSIKREDVSTTEKCPFSGRPLRIIAARRGAQERSDIPDLPRSLRSLRGRTPPEVSGLHNYRNAAPLWPTLRLQPRHAGSEAMGTAGAKCLSLDHLAVLSHEPDLAPAPGRIGRVRSRQVTRSSNAKSIRVSGDQDTLVSASFTPTATNTPPMQRFNHSAHVLR
jgi:hypothetical protein